MAKFAQDNKISFAELVHNYATHVLHINANWDNLLADRLTNETGDAKAQSNLDNLMNVLIKLSKDFYVLRSQMRDLHEDDTDLLQMMHTAGYQCLSMYRELVDAKNGRFGTQDANPRLVDFLALRTRQLITGRGIRKKRKTKARRKK